jgi:hypothetical protein
LGKQGRGQLVQQKPAIYQQQQVLQRVQQQQEGKASQLDLPSPRVCSVLNASNRPRSGASRSPHL